MSMMALTILQILWVSLAYLSATLLLPWIIWHRKLAFLRPGAQFFAYSIIGNFFCIYLVYLLQLFHISNRFTLILGTLAPFGFLAFKHKEQLVRRFDLLTNFIVSFANEEIGFKVLFFRFLNKIQNTFSGWITKWVAPRIFDGFVMLVVFILILIMYGTNAIHVYGYTASDMIVHNYWINSMDLNQIFVDGVYPFGLHCLLYYLHQIFSIPVYVLVRLFGFIQVVMVHLNLLLFLKLVCKSKYAPYTGVVIYLTSEFFNQSYVYFRDFATLPQENGMIFIYPTIYFVLLFFNRNDFDFSLINKTKENRKISYSLLFFCLGIALTLTTHFYATVIVGLMCIGIAISFLKECLRWSNLKKLLVAGCLGLSLGALPMGIFYALGTPLHNSFYWGMNVISGIEDNRDKLLISDYSPFDQEAPQNLKDGIERVIWGVEIYVTTQDHQVALFLIGSIVLLLILGFLCRLFHYSNYGKTLISFGIFMILLCMQQASTYLKIPALIENVRCAMYVAYGLAVVWSLCCDALTVLLFKKAFLRNWMGVIELITVSLVMNSIGIREPTLLSGYEPNEAIICLTNILMENEGSTSWTICSANDEHQMIWDKGYHYETITFLRDQENWTEDMVLTIPTNTVYFFIEKTPLFYYDFMSDIKPDRKVSTEGASLPLSKKEGLAPYQDEDRWITMSHMYYWAQAFQKLYPYEMETYYETDDFICFRVQQDGYNLYNFAIDYGYNT